MPVGATGGRRLRLRASVEPLAAGSELYLIRAGADDLVIRDAGAADRAVVEALAREALTAGELAAQLGLDAGAVDEKVGALAAAGVLTPAAASAPLDAEDAERFSRQQPYLAEYGDERELQRRLAAARVVVVGCGGLGTWAIAALAAAGVRRFRLIDDDRVELSNLNRQATYRPDQVGTAKVEAAAAWLRAFDRRVEVEAVASRVDGPAAARRAAADADALVLTADEPAYELGRWVNAACLEAGVPFITAGQMPPLLRVGPLYMPGGACFACHETALRAGSIAYDGYVEHVRATPTRAATLGPASALAGSAIALELMHLLIGVEPATAGAALTIDIRTLAVARDPVARDDRCAACSSQSTAVDLDTPHGPARAHLHEAADPRGALVLGHGAGGSVDSADLVAATEAALAGQVSVVLVEQPYLVAGRRSAAPAPQLDTAWKAVVEQLPLEGLPLIAGGRSSGARVACRTAAEVGAAAVLCLAFPVHPPGRPEKSRLSELDAVTVPVLVVQGTSDPFGMPPEAPGREVVTVAGNHSLARSRDAVAAAVGGWLDRILG